MKHKNNYIIGGIKRFFHCLINMHCMWDEWELGKHTCIGCYECKKTYWGVEMTVILPRRKNE